MYFPMYAIREANRKDRALLPAIEQAAGMMYRETRYADLVDAPNTSMDIDEARDRVWVIADDREAVGFAIVREFADAVHLHELDVHPRHARQGLGRRLIEHVAEWARARRARVLTLTTFADVPWNGPYYTRLGFTVVPPDVIGEDLHDILQAEIAAGIPVQDRIAMQLVL